MRYADVTTLEHAYEWLAERQYLVKVMCCDDAKLGKWRVMVYPEISIETQVVAFNGTANEALEAMREAIRGWDDYEAGKPMVPGEINWGTS